jgi:hypothetical protein
MRTGRDDLDVVPKALCKERPHGAVREPGSEDRGFGRPSLSADETTRDLAGGVEPLFVVDGQRKEVDAFTRLLRHHRRREDHGVALTDDDGAMRLLGHPADLEADRVSGHLA